LPLPWRERPRPSPKNFCARDVRFCSRALAGIITTPESHSPPAAANQFSRAREASSPLPDRRRGLSGVECFGVQFRQRAARRMATVRTRRTRSQHFSWKRNFGSRANDSRRCPHAARAVAISDHADVQSSWRSIPSRVRILLRTAYRGSPGLRGGRQFCGRELVVIEVWQRVADSSLT